MTHFLAGATCAFLISWILYKFRPTLAPTRLVESDPPTRYSGPCAAGSCSGLADLRCGGGNCTYHCQSMFGCNGVCLRSWEAKQLVDASVGLAKEAIEDARAAAKVK
jgi:hypothetical protein